MKLLRREIMEEIIDCKECGFFNKKKCPFAAFRPVRIGEHSFKKYISPQKISNVRCKNFKKEA
jgi:hypothetical protein